MFLLIPLDSDDRQESKLVSLNEVKKWVLLDVSQGRIAQIDFYDTREEITQMVEAVVVISDHEYVWPFQEQQIMVLVAHTQRSIDDIVEAFLFKELHDLAY
jgi:hypothetical protein